MFYQRGRNPSIWLDEFEKQLNWTFNIIQIHENRVVHSDEMKLQILLKKVKTDFLVSIGLSVNVELARVSMSFTYANALLTYRNTVTQMHPPKLINQGRERSQYINEQNIRRGGRFYPGGRSGGRGSQG